MRTQSLWKTMSPIFGRNLIYNFQLVIISVLFSCNNKKFFQSFFLVLIKKLDSSIFALNSLLDINGTLFDENLSDYEKVRDEMLETINKNCLWEVETRSRNYKKEKYEISKFTICSQLSNNNLDMIIELKNALSLDPSFSKSRSKYMQKNHYFICRCSLKNSTCITTQMFNL